MWSLSSLVAADQTLDTEDAKHLLREAVRAHRNNRGTRERAEAGAAIAGHASEIVADAGCVAI